MEASKGILACLAHIPALSARGRYLKLCLITCHSGQAFYIEKESESEIRVEEADESAFWLPGSMIFALLTVEEDQFLGVMYCGCVGGNVLEEICGFCSTTCVSLNTMDTKRTPVPLRFQITSILMKRTIYRSTVCISCALVLVTMAACKKSLRDRTNQALHGDEQVLKDHEILKKYPILFEVDRAKYGFSPLPEKARLSITEWDKDVFITVITENNRTIKLRKNDAGVFMWHYEKEEFRGPNKYQGKFVMQHEMIQIEYLGFGKPNPRVRYHYFGEDEFLRPSETLERIIPYLVKWGYRTAEKTSTSNGPR